MRCSCERYNVRVGKMSTRRGKVWGLGDGVVCVTSSLYILPRYLSPSALTFSSKILDVIAEFFS